MKPRRLAVYGLTAGLLGGGAAGLFLTGTTLASTRIADVSSVDSGAVAGSTTNSSTPSDTSATTGGDSTSTTAPAATTTSGPAPSSPSGTTGTAPAAPASPAPADGDRTKAVLDPLVAKGTITQAQEDAILAALRAAHPDHGPGGGHGPGGHGPGGPGFGNLDATARALGMTTDDLRTALEGGRSLADVATAKGIDPAKVVDALVADLKAHLAADVASGEHTQAEADQILAQAKIHIEDFVNGTAPAGGPGGPGGFGGGGPGGHGPGGTGGSSTTGTTA